MRLLHCILRKKWSLILFYFLFIKFLSADVTFYLYKVTLYLYKADLHRIRHCVWAGRSSCCLDIWDKLQKWICRTIGPSLVATLDWNLTSLLKCSQLILFYRCYFGMCSSKLAELVPLPYSRGRSCCYSNRMHDFSVISKCYKDVHVNSIFSHRVRFWNSLPAKHVPLIYDLNDFMSTINRHIFGLF